MGAEMSMWNVKYGYSEGILRGFRSGFLTPEDYRKLSLAENLDDLKSALQDTDYGDFLANEASPLSVTTISVKCHEKLAKEFRFIQSEATGDLKQFMMFLAYEKMIDNIINLIQGTMNNKKPEELLSRMDPLGWFPELRTISAIDFSAGYEDLYRTLLCDTPVGGYFEAYIKAHAAANDEQIRNMSEVVTWISELDMELMRNVLKNAWLEDFYQFSASQGGTTSEVMEHILKCECDFRCLLITLNTLRRQSAGHSQVDRSLLFPRIGYLYPEGTEKLRKAYNEAAIRAALSGYDEYLDSYEQSKGLYNFDEKDEETKTTGALVNSGPAQNQNQLSIEDVLYKKQLRMYEMAFEQSMHFGIFYAYMKLKEQEIRNITWIGEMIVIKKKEALAQLLPIFEPRL